MRVLFDQGVPVPLRTYIQAEVITCHERGWGRLANGVLLKQAEAEFEVLVTTDKNLGYQQNLSGRRIAVFVLPTTRWPLLRPHGAEIGRAVLGLRAADFRAWQLPE